MILFLLGVFTGIIVGTISFLVFVILITIKGIIDVG